MPYTPSNNRRGSRRRGANPETPASQKQRSDGVCRDGEWWCNCKPRQKAGHYHVTKEGPNKDKWFWRCRARPGCRFWLWEYQAEARLREGNSKGKGRAAAPETEEDDDDEEEEDMPPRTPSLTQRNLSSYGVKVTPRRRDSNATTSGGEDAEDTAGKRSSKRADPVTPSATADKRKRDALHRSDDQDSDEFGQLDSDAERDMAALADTAEHSATKTPEAAARTILDPTTGLPTPATARTLFQDSAAASSRHSKRQKTVSFEDDPETPSKSFSSTATIGGTAVNTPSTTETAPSSSPPTSSPADGNSSIPDPTEEVMAILQPCNLDPSILRSVRHALTMSARRARGLVMGRDAARASARDKDARIAKLQERIAALENKDRMQDRHITDMKAGIMKLYQSS